MFSNNVLYSALPPQKRLCSTHHYNLAFLTVSEENKATENTAATCVELQCEFIRQDIKTSQTQNHQHINEAHANVTHKMCMYCCSSACVFFSETLPVHLRAFGQPRMTNHMKWKGDYRSFYTIVKPPWFMAWSYWDSPEGNIEIVCGRCLGGHTSLCCGRC